MPLPATRLALPDVGPTGDQGPDLAACTDTQIDRLLRRGQPADRAVRAHDVQSVQRGYVPALSRATAATSSAPAPHDRGARQRPLSSRRTAGSVPATTRRTCAADVSATLQSAARLDRTRLETDSASGDTQSLLRNTRRCSQSRQRLLQPLAPAESDSVSTMLHYLSRCV